MALNILRKVRELPAPSMPAGERVYAVGDIHGETALFSQLLRRIRGDLDARPRANTTLVILGDFIDRGAGAADMLLTLNAMANRNLVILKGNHEATLVRAYAGDEEALGFWLKFGGTATLCGMGATAAAIQLADPAQLLALLRSAIPERLIAWLDALPSSWSAGDYFFVHAGIRPGVRLDEQDDDDLLWIRRPFIDSHRDHGKIIVHGHTLEAGEPKLGNNRIGLDTGAFEHGRLTALGLEGDRQWIVQALAG